jgi:hypothetical protein
MFSSLVLLFIAINSILRKNETIDRRFNRGKLLFSASINSTIVTTSLILGWNNATNRLQSLNFGIDDFVRATYLFLDRVIASSFLPFWGHVSQQEDGVVLITSRIFGNLEIRLVLGVFLALIVAIGILVVNFRERIVLVTILLNVFVYSFVLGITFGLQPRYSLVASFLLQNCVFLVLALSEKSDRKSLVIKIISLVVILLQISTTKIDSKLREFEVGWKKSVNQAQGKCLESGHDFFIISIPPKTSLVEWSVQVSCSKLIDQP